MARLTVRTDSELIERSEVARWLTVNACGNVHILLEAFGRKRAVKIFGPPRLVTFLPKIRRYA